MQENAATPPTPPAVVIIGGGFSGVMTAVQLALQATQPLRITLINKGSPVARGVAYSAEDDIYLLNVPAGKMSAFPEQQSHFVNWLEMHDNIQRYCLPGETIGTTFFPRRLYGQYLHDILTETVQSLQLKPGVTLDVMPEVATDIQPEEVGYTVFTDEGSKVRADRVVLALGNFTPGSPFRHGQPACAGYQPNPWLVHDFDVPADPAATVLFIGTGLTTIDYLLLLRQRGYKGKIVAVSPKGYLPQPHQSSQPTTDLRAVLKPPYELNHLVHQLNRYLRDTCDKGINCPALVDSLRAETQDIWLSLSPEDKSRFLRHLSPLWNANRHRIPAQVAAVINEMLQSGQLEVKAGRVLELRPQEQDIEVIIRPRGSSSTMSLRAQQVVNCTGPQGNFNCIEHPLVQNLIRRHLIEAHPLRVGLHARPDCSLVAEHPAAAGLFAVGPALRGVLWESTAVPEIRVQAKQVATQLLEQLSRVSVT